MLPPPSVCSPHSSPETRRQRGQRAHTQNVLEGRVLVVLGETRPQVRAPLGQYPPPDQRWGWEHSQRMGIAPPPDPEMGLGALT